MTTTRVGPAAHLNLTIVDDLVQADGRHNSRRYRHVLNTEAVAVHCVLLADLGCVVEVLLGLNGGETGTLDGLDLVEPFATSGTNVCLFSQSNLDT
jgi:hypothetical protein